MWRRVSGSPPRCSFFFFNDTATTEIYTLSLHDALPIYCLDDVAEVGGVKVAEEAHEAPVIAPMQKHVRSEEHTSELQSRSDLVCRLLLEKKKKATVTSGLRCTTSISLRRSH